jgi:hypothetical protein
MAGGFNSATTLRRQMKEAANRGGLFVQIRTFFIIPIRRDRRANSCAFLT